mgnify:CR=1 FL=1
MIAGRKGWERVHADWRHHQSILIKELADGPVVMEVNDTPTIFRDEEDGELSYNFSMAILDFDLED